MQAPNAFPLIRGKGAEGQQQIEAIASEFRDVTSSALWNKAGFLLVTQGQDTRTARLTAVASDLKHLGYNWMPVIDMNADRAKATAVFLNSTIGRLLLLRNPGTKLAFPNYNPSTINALPIPDLTAPHICSTLADCWEATRHMTVPQYRDGECEVRQLWDAAVCDALGWDEDEIAGYRKLLHDEPHVRGFGYGQYQD